MVGSIPTGTTKKLNLISMTSFLEENLEEIKKLEVSYPNNMEFGNLFESAAAHSNISLSSFYV